MSDLSSAYAAMQSQGIALSATFSTHTAPVLLDAPDVSEVGGFAQARDYQIRFESATLPGLTYNSSITVGGTAYTVREVMQIGDGAESVAKLSKN